MSMTTSHRRHVILPEQALQFLEEYQRKYGLSSFSAALEAATKALQQEELRRSYAQFAHDYANDPQEQAEAEAWLALPMQEHQP